MLTLWFLPGSTNYIYTRKVKMFTYISIGDLSCSRIWEVHSECSSSTGDPHEQFGRCPGASLLHFFPSECGNFFYGFWMIKNCSWSQDWLAQLTHEDPRIIWCRSNFLSLRRKSTLSLKTRVGEFLTLKNANSLVLGPMPSVWVFIMSSFLNLGNY